MDSAAQAGGAAVHIGDVGSAAQALGDGGGHLVLPTRFLPGVVVGLGVQLGLLVALLPAGSLEVKLLDEEGEHEVVDQEEHNAQGDNQQPAGLFIALEDAEQGQVNEAAGEGQAHGNVEDVAEHIGKARKHGADDKQHRGHKQEGELQRLGDAGEDGGESGRQEQAAHLLFPFRLGTAVHSQSRSGETEDIQHKLTGETPGTGRGEVGHGGISQLGKEDVLGSGHHGARHLHSAAHSGLPEGQIEHVVQAEGNEQALDHAEQEGAEVARAVHHHTQGVDALLNGLPDKKHQNAYQGKDQGADDGHKPGAAEEGEHLGQLDLIKAVVQGSNSQAYDDAAEGAHLQRGNTQHGGGGTLQQVFHPAGQADHGGDAGVHHQEGDGSGQGGHFLLLAGHTDGHADGEDQGQVIKDHAAALAQNGENKVRDRAGTHQAQQVIGGQGRLVGKRASQAQQQSCHRQDGDGEHKGSAHPLQHAKKLFLHRATSLFKLAGQLLR